MTATATSIVNLPEPRSRVGRLVEILAGMVWGITFIAMILGISLLVLTGNHPGGRDFVSYWTAGHLILHHANPYDSARILATERSVGFGPDSQSLIMRNAPWSLCLVMPLGLLGLRLGALFWALLQVGSLAVSVHLLWVMHGRPNSKLHVLAYSFGPALFCILVGQTAVFPLLGIVLFLRFHRQQQFLAGVSLWLCALKPHLLLPFGAVLIAWILVSRSYRILGGLAVSLLVSAMIATILDPAVWSQYHQMMHEAGLQSEYIPCVGVALRFVIHQQTMWLEYIPAVAGCIWSVVYYRKHHATWNWMEHGALLMLVSIFVAPYEWCTDQTLLIPALLLGAYRATSRNQLVVFIVASATVEIEMFLGVTLHSSWLLWTAPFWIGWFLYVTTRTHAEADARIPQGEVVSGSL